MCLFTIGEQPMTYFYVRSLSFLSSPVFSFLFSLYMLCFLFFLTDIIPVSLVLLQLLFLFLSLFHSLSHYISILLLTLSLLTYSLRSYFLNSTCIVADIIFLFFHPFHFELFILSHCFICFYLLFIIFFIFQLFIFIFIFLFFDLSLIHISIFLSDIFY